MLEQQIPEVPGSKVSEEMLARLALVVVPHLKGNRLEKAYF